GFGPCARRLGDRLVVCHSGRVAGFLSLHVAPPSISIQITIIHDVLDHFKPLMLRISRYSTLRLIEISENSLKQRGGLGATAMPLSFASVFAAVIASEADARGKKATLDSCPSLSWLFLCFPTR